MARSPVSAARPGRYEAMLAAALAAVLALLVYLPHIQDGGWYLDDWIDVALMSEAGDLSGAFSAMSDQSYRPGLALSLTAFYAIAGETPETYLLIGALLAGLQGWLFYLVLRTVRMRAAIAAVAAALFVVLPVIDATRLWMAAFPIQISGILFLLGLLAALHGLETKAGRRAVAWHAGAAILFLAAVLTYELVAGLIVCAALLYAVRSGWRPALRRWPADLGAVAVAVAYLAPRGASDRDAQLSLGFLWDRAGQTATEAGEVFRWLLPWHGVLGGALGVLALLAGMLGAGIAIGRGGPDGRGLAAWVWIAALAVVFSLAGLVMLLPAEPYFVPRISGLGNRTGAFAALGAVVLLIALIVLALGGIGALLRRPRAGLALAALLVVATGLNLAAREYRHQEPWAESWQEQQRVLAAVDASFGGPPPGEAAIVSFGHETFIEPADVSVFAHSWDLRGALHETYDLPGLVAHPWRDGSCGPRGAIFPDETASDTGAEPYGYERLIFVDVTDRKAARIPNRGTCEAAVAALTG